MIEIIEHIIAANPTLSNLLVVMGVLRLINKPLFTILRIITEATETATDDKALSELESSKGYKAFLYLLDWFSSVKVGR